MASVLLAPGAAFAQASDETAANEREILVTAQRRSERLIDIPATLAALDSEALRAAGVVDISSVAPRVPGFYAGGFGSSRPQLYLRGIGTRQFDPGSEASVGVFVDEGYLGRTGGVLGALKDIERIEVLKGPQGTLYGRNTIGGAINVISKSPTSDLDAEAEAGFGNFGRYDLFAAVSGPIAGEAVKARAAGWRSYRRGYVTNLTSGKHAQGTDNFGGRLRLEINPAENVQIDLIGEIMRDDGPSFQGESVGTVPNPNSILLGTGVPLKSANPFKQFYSANTEYDRNIDALTGKVDVGLGFGSLVSVTSYRKMSYFDFRDFDNTNLDVINQTTAERSKQFTQEVRLVSDRDGSLSFGGVIDWIIGVYYYKDTSFHTDIFDFGVNTSNPGRIGQQDETIGNYKTKSYAAFGQLTAHFSDTLDLTVGARYSKDKKQSSFQGKTTDALPLVAVPYIQNNPWISFDSFDPKATLSFRPNRNLNIYASFSQGFKAGGYQFTPLTQSQAATVFRDEKLKSYEVGFKTSLMDRKVQINGALYRYDYDNIQVSRIVQLLDGTTPSLISNAGKSRIEGGELDVTLEPIEGLMFNAAYAYTKARYLDYRVSPAAGAADYSGTRMVRAPKHSVNFSGQYEFPVGEDSSLMLRGDVALLSTFFHEPGEGQLTYGTTIPFTREPSYAVANFRLAYRMGNWKVSGWVNNAFDKLYRRTVHALPGQVINYYAEPRTYGMTLGWTM
ncbi:MAG TPA: TonB-dependent receptor [Novosphingobium sp.]|nr:TonB-dependent receptor [Novosphingobium sp.]